ncbi:MAG: RNA polymerase sigma factor [Lachnospiraceae bacterium]|nr:RNA polymerase sigma factor [Lachnospiraceae bacterium]MCM1230815.1 RNA polymerase sigma factor [Ruminococcus flavefaciens]
MEELTEKYDKVYRYCFYKVRNAYAAEDITQETFLRYFAQNNRLKSGENMAYLYTIAKNLCKNFFRQKQTEELPEDYPIEDFTEKSDRKIAVRAALEQLDERHKEVILLRYFGDISVNETAKTIGISRFAVYRLERSALNEMKTYLKGVL